MLKYIINQKINSKSGSSTKDFNIFIPLQVIIIFNFFLNLAVIFTILSIFKNFNIFISMR